MRLCGVFAHELFPIAGHASGHDLGYQFVSGPPADRAELSQRSSCLDFPASDDPGTIPIGSAINEVQGIVDLCRSRVDDRAAAQTRLWDQTLADLRRPRADVRQGPATGLGGTCLQDLRWQYLQFDRRNDRSWFPLLGRIQEYFELREQAETLLRRYREPGSFEQKVEIRSLYDAMVVAINVQLKELNAARLQLSGVRSTPSAGDRSSLPRHAGPASRVARPWESAARPGAMGGLGAPTALPTASSIAPSTAPRMSMPVVDESGIVYPPTIVNDWKAAWRP
jgi:hypothetical protein